MIYKTFQEQKVETILVFPEILSTPPKIDNKMECIHKKSSIHQLHERESYVNENSMAVKPHCNLNAIASCSFKMPLQKSKVCYSSPVERICCTNTDCCCRFNASDFVTSEPILHQEKLSQSLLTLLQHDISKSSHLIYDDCASSTMQHNSLPSECSKKSSELNSQLGSGKQTGTSLTTMQHVGDKVDATKNDSAALKDIADFSPSMKNVVQAAVSQVRDVSLLLFTSCSGVSMHITNFVNTSYDASHLK